MKPVPTPTPRLRRALAGTMAVRLRASFLAGFMAAAAAIGLTALVTSLPSRAQGATKPVEALVVNPANRPVPVAVVPAAAPATAKCLFRFNTADFVPVQPIPVAFLTYPISQLECADGVTRLDVDRVVYITGPSIQTTSTNQVHYTLSVGLGRLGSVTVDFDTPIATLSDGTPDLALRRTVRVDKAAAQTWLMMGFRCSSGIAGLQPICGGTVYLLGTRVD